MMLFLRIILLPFTLLYALGIWLRGLLYKSGVFTRSEFDLPVICIGNLAAGGTGKTPHTEWLISKLRGEMKIAVLSRGYKRKTSGYVFADIAATPDSIGDEPYQIKRKFPDIAVGVSESRVFGIPQLLTDAPDTQLVLMDDGFQHMQVKAGLYILLTDFHNLFTRDWLLPSGLLREFRSGYRRANMIVVTKCPPALEEEKKQQIIREINPMPDQQVLFASLLYGNLVPVFPAHTPRSYTKQTHVLAFSGIARSTLFEAYLEEQFTLEKGLRFGDHHDYTADDLQKISMQFAAIGTADKILVCTEKDAVKLQKDQGSGLLSDLPLYYLPLQIVFHGSGDSLILEAVRNTLHRFE